MYRRKMETLSRSCANCGTIFFKNKNTGMPAWKTRRRFCSQKCKVDSQRGTPSKKRGNKYPTGRAVFLPCRICGGATSYYGKKTNPLFKMVNCGSPECRIESNAIRAKRISSAKRRSYKTGKTKKRHDAWRTVSRISDHEFELWPWFKAMGWQRQYVFKPQIPDAGYPRCFWLDFAEPTQLLCVELDGSSHRDRIDRDTRRDELLTARGWKVLRVTNPDQAAIAAWIQETIVSKK
jgi:very-short-patch-repair endonuclease